MINRKVLILFAFAVALALPSKVENSRHYLSEDPEENDFEVILDDMILSREQILDSFTTSRIGIRNEQYRWPHATVYYKIYPGFNSEEKALILKAMEEISVRSCIKFKKMTKNTVHYVRIYKHPERCWSHVGYRKKVRKLGITPKCFKKIGIIWHLLYHTLGFYHMHSAYDRDDYVRVYLKNVKEKYRHYFAKYSNKMVTDFGLPYDYSSVMHYGRKTFSVNGKNTIVPVNPDAVIGQRYKLSDGDIQRLVRMYKCH